MPECFGTTPVFHGFGCIESTGTADDPGFPTCTPDDDFEKFGPLGARQFRHFTRESWINHAADAGSDSEIHDPGHGVRMDGTRVGKRRRKHGQNALQGLHAMIHIMRPLNYILILRH